MRSFKSSYREVVLIFNIMVQFFFYPLGKGVLLTHGNLIASAAGFCRVIKFNSSVV